MTGSEPAAGTVAIVLPPREGFAPAEVGAIGLLVQRLHAAGAGGSVVGRALGQSSFPAIPYHAVRPGWGWSASARYASGVMRVLRRLRPALVEVHNRPDVAQRIARGLPGARVLLVLHNDPQAMRGLGTAAQRAGLGRRLRVACVSDWLRGRFMQGVQGPAPALLPNCIDFVAVPSDLPRGPCILFAGRMVADKGADLFVQACALALPQLPEWRACMIGADRFRADSPETPFTRAWRPQAEAAGITLSGHLPHAAVLRAMAGAAIVVVPSRWPEPFGLTALEAMACGAALVCTRAGGLPEVAGDAALYVAPDPQAIAEALCVLAADPDRRAALGRAGQARAAGFDAPPAARRLLALRQEVLDA